MKKVMLISYVFPPAGGAGVQRALKLVKYLPRFGWQAVVVTPKSPAVPVRDDSYLCDLHPETKVCRLPILEPGVNGVTGGGNHGAKSFKARLAAMAAGAMFPDPRVVWLPTALPGALAAARRYQVQAVLVTAPPFSPFLLGASVAGLLGLPLILDFRDDWSGYFTSGFETGGSRLRRWLVRTSEGILVNRAAGVTLTTAEAIHWLRRLHGGPAKKYALIPNGYDPADFSFMSQEGLAPPDDGCLHLLYTGTVFKVHPLSPLWQAAARLTTAQRKKLRITIVGRIAPDGETTDPGLPGLKVRVLPYEPHQTVLRRLCQAHGLLVTQADEPGLERMVPAKLFEYLAARRPVLAIVPPGAAQRIVTQANAGHAVHPSDIAGLAEILARWIESPPPRLGPPPLEFDRRLLAGLMARVLDQAVEG